MSSKKSETRARLLSVARRLLDSRGFEAVSMESVASEAGVSRQAVYLHFGSRSGLLVAVARLIDEVEGPPVEAFQRMLAAPDAEAMLDAALDIHLHYEAAIHGYAQALQATRLADTTAQAAWDDRMRARRGGLGRIVRRLVDDGRLAPGWTQSEAEDFLFALLSVDSYETLVVQTGWTPKQYKERMQAAIAGALFARA